MFDDLEQFLTNSVTPEYKAVVMECCQTLLDMGLLSHSSDIDFILSQMGNYDLPEVVEQIDDCLAGVCVGVLEQHGVMVDDDTQLRLLTSLLKGLMLVTNYDDAETLEALCLSDESTEEIFCALMAHVGEEPLEVFLPVVLKVNPALIKRIQEEVVNHVVEETLPPVDSGVKFRVLSLVNQIPDLLVLEAVSDGVRLGSPVERLLERYQARLNELPLERAITEYVGLVLASGVNDESILEVCREKMETVFTDINAITKGLSHLTKVLSKVEYEKA